MPIPLTSQLYLRLRKKKIKPFPLAPSQAQQNSNLVEQWITMNLNHPQPWPSSAAFTLLKQKTVTWPWGQAVRVTPNCLFCTVSDSWHPWVGGALWVVGSVSERPSRHAVGIQITGKFNTLLFPKVICLLVATAQISWIGIQCQWG